MTTNRVFLILVSAALILLAQTAQINAAQPEYLHMNKVIDKLERNLLVTGIWVNCLHPSSAISLTRTNKYPSYEESLTTPMIDFALIDMEHEPFDTSELRDFLLAMNSRREVITKGNLQPNVSVLVRVPCDADGSFEWMVKQALDCGAHGVIVPHVRNAAQARRVVSACRYPQATGCPIPEPKGIRGGGPKLCSYLWGMSVKDYVKRADVWPLNPKGDILAIVMIEDVEGLKNIEEILSVPGIGAVFFGPYDFSLSCGVAGNKRHPKVLEAEKTVKKACDKHNVPMIAFANAGNMQRRIEEKQRILMIGGDYDLDSRISGSLDYLRKNMPGLKVGTSR
ncbi:MAG: HpcH/HpaI aldolase family protein [Planctomycetota bacterium]|jgi:4-hydroxy-2-oxoheptanedioate aldolase